MLEHGSNNSTRLDRTEINRTEIISGLKARLPTTILVSANNDPVIVTCSFNLDAGLKSIVITYAEE